MIIEMVGVVACEMVISVHKGRSRGQPHMPTNHAHLCSDLFCLPFSGQHSPQSNDVKKYVSPDISISLINSSSKTKCLELNRCKNSRLVGEPFFVTLPTD